MALTSRSAAAAAVLAMCVVQPAAAAGYAFEELATSGGAFNRFSFGAPVLNDVGVVAFTAASANGSDLLVRASTAGTEVLATDRLRFSRFGNPTINASGQVGFEGSFRRISAEGIFRTPGAGATKVAGTRAAGDFDFVNAGPSINAAGVVAFSGERIVGSQFIDGVYAGSGGSVQAVYDTTGAFSDFNGNPALNDHGAVAFLADRKTGGSGLFMGAGGAFVTVADDSGLLVGSLDFSDPSLNGRGDVAFRAGTNEDFGDNGSATGSGIFLYRDGVLNTIVQGGFAEIFSLGGQSLNEHGELVFLLEPTFGEQLLLTGADRVADRVLGTGDTLLGRMVTNIIMSREALNDGGQIAFTAFFADGGSAVILATPVPEVPTGMLLGAGLFAVAMLRCTRAKRRSA